MRATTRMRTWASSRLLVALCACLLGLCLIGGSVRADAAPETAPASAARNRMPELPSGYVTKTDGPVRWTYPVVAEDEVRTLRALQPKSWRRIVAELGVAVAPALDIRVARNPKEMRALVATNTPLPGYADGIAFPESGLVLLTLTEPETFLRPDLATVLTHELSHVALYRAVNGVPVPRWFSEGVAVQQAQESGFARIKTLWEGTLSGRLLSLDALSEHFPGRRGEVDLAYAQSADFVGYLLSGGDERTRFRGLLHELAEGHSFADAIQSAYHVQLAYMEREWRAELTQRFGRWPMLFMGLTFLWVLGAVLLLIGFLRTRARDRATLQRWAIEEQPVLATIAPVAQPAPPAGAVQSSVDDFFDNRHAKNEPGVPTVVHDGQSHTLH